jgi:hypothetical protein
MWALGQIAACGLGLILSFPFPSSFFPSPLPILPSCPLLLQRWSGIYYTPKSFVIADARIQNVLKPIFSQYYIIWAKHCDSVQLIIVLHILVRIKQQVIRSLVCSWLFTAVSLRHWHFVPGRPHKKAGKLRKLRVYHVLVNAARWSDFRQHCKNPP